MKTFIYENVKEKDDDENDWKEMGMHRDDLRSIEINTDKLK
jgi:hypothetical protein